MSSLLTTLTNSMQNSLSTPLSCFSRRDAKRVVKGGSGQENQGYMWKEILYDVCEMYVDGKSS